MMKLYRSLLLSRRALGARKLRSVLALVGLSLGVAAVMTVGALGEGAEREAVRKIEDMGTNLLVVQAGRVGTIAGRPRQESLATSLTLDDWREVAEESRALRLSAPTVERTAAVKYGDVMTRTMILGSTSDYARACNSRLARGRLFTDDEEASSARVAVLGHQAALNLLPSEPSGPRPGPKTAIGSEADGERRVETLLGGTIRVGNVPFAVIGVLAEKGVTQDGANEDDKILIPIRTAMRRVANTDHIKAIFASVARREDMPQAEREIAAVLRERHRLDREAGQADDFTIQSQATLLAAARSASESLSALGAWVGAVSVALGGVGIFSLLLLSVKERRPEIGLRMAVGARRRDILLQFLWEALLLGMAGGALGIVAGATAAAAIGAFTTWATAISMGPALSAAVFSTGIGLAAGVYPAGRAASLDPVVALTGE